MGSQLNLIFNALQGISIDFTFNEVYEIGAEDWTNPRASINKVPTRILAPLATNPEGNVNKISLGKRGSAEWLLSDILLWRDVVSGKGIETDYPYLIHYMQAYTDTMLENRQLLNSGNNSATISDVQLTVATHKYGKKDYSSVIAVLTIMETFTHG